VGGRQPGFVFFEVLAGLIFGDDFFGSRPAWREPSSQSQRWLASKSGRCGPGLYDHRAFIASGRPGDMISAMPRVCGRGPAKMTSINWVPGGLSVCRREPRCTRRGCWTAATVGSDDHRDAGAGGRSCGREALNPRMCISLVQHENPRSELQISKLPLELVKATHDALDGDKNSCPNTKLRGGWMGSMENGGFLWIRRGNSDSAKIGEENPE